jgi:hypothetical protein
VAEVEVAAKDRASVASDVFGGELIRSVIRPAVPSARALAIPARTVDLREIGVEALALRKKSSTSMRRFASSRA